MRYLAVALPPFLLLVAAGLAHAGRLGHRRPRRWSWCCGRTTARRPRRATCARSPTAIGAEPARPATSSISTQPEQRPGAAPLPAAGAALRDADRAASTDVGVTDWRDGVERLRGDLARSATSSRCSTRCSPASGSCWSSRSSSTHGPLAARRGRRSCGCARRVSATRCLDDDPPLSRSADPIAADRRSRRRDRIPCGRRCLVKAPRERGRREHEARAAPVAVRERRASPPMRSASSRPIARPSPKPPSEPAAAAAVEALEDVLALLVRDARAAVGDRRRVAALVALGERRAIGSPRGAVAQRVVEQDAHDARDRVRVAAAPARAVGRHDVDRRRRARAARSSNSAATARASSPSSTGSERSCTAASSRERSSSSLGERREPPQLAARVGDLALGVVDVDAGRRAGPPRAAPSCPGASSAACAARATRSRRTRAARPPGGAAPPACARARGRGRRPRRGRSSRGVGDVRALGDDPQRGRAQARRGGAAACWRARAPSATATSEADAAAAQQRVAHLARRRR